MKYNDEPEVLPLTMRILHNIPRKYLLYFLILVCLIAISFMVAVLYLTDSDRISKKALGIAEQATGYYPDISNSTVQLLPNLTISAPNGTVNLDKGLMMDLEQISVKMPFWQVYFPQSAFPFDMITIAKVHLKGFGHEILLNDVIINRAQDKLTLNAKVGQNNLVWDFVNGHHVIAVNDESGARMTFDFDKAGGSLVAKFDNARDFWRFFPIELDDSFFADIVARENFMAQPMSLKVDFVFTGDKTEFTVKELTLAGQSLQANGQLAAGSFYSKISSEKWNNDNFSLIPFSKSSFVDYLKPFVKEFSTEYHFNEFIMKNAQYYNVDLHLNSNELEQNLVIDSVENSESAKISGVILQNWGQKIASVELNIKDWQVSPYAAAWGLSIADGRLTAKIQASQKNDLLWQNFSFEKLAMANNGTMEWGITNGKMAGMDNLAKLLSANQSIKLKNIDYCANGFLTFGAGQWNLDKLLFASKELKGQGKLGYDKNLDEYAGAWQVDYQNSLAIAQLSGAQNSPLVKLNRGAGNNAKRIKWQGMETCTSQAE